MSTSDGIEGQARGPDEALVVSGLGMKRTATAGGEVPGALMVAPAPPHATGNLTWAA